MNELSGYNDKKRLLYSFHSFRLFLSVSTFLLSHPYSSTQKKKKITFLLSLPIYNVNVYVHIDYIYIYIYIYIYKEKYICTKLCFSLSFSATFHGGSSWSKTQLFFFFISIIIIIFFFLFFFTVHHFPPPLSPHTPFLHPRLLRFHPPMAGRTQRPDYPLVTGPLRLR
jgi:CDP-diglyceride synthetase